MPLIYNMTHSISAHVTFVLNIRYFHVQTVS